VNDFDDLLAGLHALNNFLAERFDCDALDEIAGNLEIYIRFEQRKTDFAQCVAGVFLGNFSESTQIFESILELAA
jgi:hypothetical protein